MNPKRDKPHGPEELAAVLKTQSPVLVVGGQAVNLWALHYYQRTSDLAPFVSRDIDLLGSRATLEEVATLAKSKPQYFSLRPPTNALGVVIAKNKEGEPILIEVLKHVHGVTNEELREPSYTFEIGESRISVCLPGPVALLKAKIANLADLSRQGRQDEKHVRILCRIMPDYWQDLCRAVTSGEIEERKLINYLETTLRLARSTKGRTALKRLSLDVTELFEGLLPNNLPKVRSFIEKRLQRNSGKRG